MIDPADERRRDTAGLAPAFAAARARLGFVALLFILAVSAWWFTLDRMRGMDGGPGTELGPLGWFLSVWVVMMAAMMFPSASLTVALYSRMTRTRARLAPLVFTSGYLLTWSAAGVVAFAISNLGAGLLGDELSWHTAGRWVAGSILAVAALYELTPLKDVCLGKCRSPLGFLLGSWRGGLSGALQMGAKHGAWCVGCCWALMAAFFALGVMSIAWMAFVAALIAAEKMLPWRRAATYGTAVILLLLAVLLVAAPDAIPGLTIPDSGHMKQASHFGRMAFAGPQANPPVPAAKDKGPNGGEPLVEANTDVRKAEDEPSLRRLRPLLDLPVELVLPAHGEPTDRAALERVLS